MLSIEKDAEKLAEDLANECVVLLKEKLKESFKYAFLNGSESCFQAAKRDVKELLYYVEDNNENKTFRDNIKRAWGLDI